MTPSRPYLIRALYDWIIDNDMTPYIVFNAEHPDVQLPMDYVQDGTLVLNISPSACRGLHIENDRIVLSAKFGGTAHQIFSPPTAALAIYAKENGRGMVFGMDEDIASPEDGDGGDGPTKPSGPPALRVVK